MTVRERLLALKLFEKQQKHPEHAKQMGVLVSMVGKDDESKEGKND